MGSVQKYVNNFLRIYKNPNGLIYNLGYYKFRDNSQKLKSTCHYVHISRVLNSWKFKKTFKTGFSSTNPIIDGPDYTFLDGKPTPLRPGQLKRAIKQKEAINRVFKLKKELDFAKDYYKKMTEQEKLERQKIIESKLKEKDAKI